MFQQLAESSGNTVGYKVIGKLTDEDYKGLMPELDRLIDEAGAINMLVDMQDFHGIELKAVWDDLMLGIKHRNDIQRLALVGARKWEEWMAQLGKPLFAGGLKYFDSSELEQAWKWARDGS